MEVGDEVGDPSPLPVVGVPVSSGLPGAAPVLVGLGVGGAVAGVAGDEVGASGVGAALHWAHLLACQCPHNIV